MAPKTEDNDSGCGGDGSHFGDQLAGEFFLSKHEFFLQWRQGSLVILVIVVILVIDFPNSQGDNKPSRRKFIYDMMKTERLLSH